MSSSDSDAPKKVTRRPAAAAKADSDSDSDSDAGRKKVVARRGPARGRAAAKSSSSDSSSDSDSDSPSKPTTRRQVKAKGSDSDSDSDSGAPSARQPRQVDLWPVINYDDMSEEAFYELLKSKTRQQRQEDRKKWTEGKGAEEEVEKVEPFSDDANAGYTYSKMLERVYNIINGGTDTGATAGGEKKVKLPVPVVEKSGTKTTSLNNFAKMCKAMNRDQSQVKDFIEKELTTTSSVDSNSCLIMKLRNVKVHQMEQVFQKYVEAYCQCGNCSGIHTTLEKNPTTRLWMLKCLDCKASRNVQTASGATYKAQIGKRPKQF